MLGLLVALLYCVHRVFSIPLLSRLSSASLVMFFGFFIYHISYLSLFRFDYGYNMKACVVVALSHNFIWLVWSLWNRNKIPHALSMAFVVLSLTASALLEVFDFPALWRILDAHSLWHFSTIPCIRLYWKFLLKDSTYQLSIKKK